jgi:uncharacterized protein (TIGR02145 family)
VTSDGGSEIIVFGVCWSTSPNPTISHNKTSYNTGIGSYTSIITGLTENTTYYVRAYATNNAGTSYGNEISFKTNLVNKGSTVPTLTTTAVSAITSTSAISGGNITDDGGGDITARGVFWNRTPDSDIYPDEVTTDGIGTGSFVSNLSNLNPGTTYYVKAYAVNGVGIAFGPILSFTTDMEEPNPNLTYGKVSDIDGNDYKTIQIGIQEWMAENLKTTKYNDGNSIPNVTDFIEWSDLITGVYCWYKNDASAYKATYGALYNWFTVSTGKLCPAGWHVPSDAEWTTLYGYLGGAGVAGGKLKETGTTHWISPNTGATNSSGFTALPGGTLSLFNDPDFSGWGDPGSSGIWWSASASIYS